MEDLAEQSVDEIVEIDGGVGRIEGQARVVLMADEAHLVDRRVEVTLSRVRLIRRQDGYFDVDVDSSNFNHPS